MQVIVTGGRDFADKDMIARNLAMLKPTFVIEGGARGAYRLAREWAKANGVKWHTEDADWTQFGLGAGHKRNRAMLDKFPDAVVLAFPGNKGTRNCVMQATARKRTVIKAE